MAICLGLFKSGSSGFHPQSEALFVSFWDERETWRRVQACYQMDLWIDFVAS